MHQLPTLKRVCISCSLACSIPVRDKPKSLHMRRAYGKTNTRRSIHGHSTVSSSWHRALWRHTGRAFRHSLFVDRLSGGSFNRNAVAANCEPTLTKKKLRVYQKTKKVKGFGKFELTLSSNVALVRVFNIPLPMVEKEKERERERERKRERGGGKGRENESVNLSEIWTDVRNTKQVERPLNPKWMEA